MYFNSSYRLNSQGHAHLTSDQILIFNKKLRHKSTSCLNENKIENNARPRQPRRKQPEKKWCTRAPPRPRGCVLRLRPSFAPRPRSLWPAAELRFAAIVCSTLCVVVAAHGQHLSSCLPLASRTRWRRRGGTQPARPRGLRLLAAAVALTGLSLAPRPSATGPGPRQRRRRP